ncbi:VanW family protein [Rhodococcus sp. NPDC059234]|uniref:VanW family protein n=1 Tax=Rhodococcus sp. NPDC059234 TaxID=3346781 RepID=UPI003672DA0E
MTGGIGRHSDGEMPAGSPDDGNETGGAEALTVRIHRRDPAAGSDAPDVGAVEAQPSSRTFEPESATAEPQPASPTVEPQTVAMPTAGSPPVQPPAAPAPDQPQASGRSRRFKVGVGVASVLAVGAVVYAVDYAMSSDRVPRGVTVVGVEIGGQTRAAAEAELRAQIGPRAQQPVQVRAGEVQAQFVPEAAGLGVDWPATLDRAGSQPLNPLTRLTSLFSQREVGVSATRDDAKLAAAVDSLRAQTDFGPVEGAVVFEGASPVGVAPRSGQALDGPGAESALAAGWADQGGVEVPVQIASVAVTQDGVDRAMREVAVPASSADLVVSGRDGARSVLGRDKVGAVLAFAPDGRGGLAPQYNVDAAIGLLGPQLASTEVQPKDASISLAGGTPTVVPAVAGDTIDWHKTLAELPALLTGNGPRTVAAVYQPKPPALTTEAAQKLGIREVIGEFTSGGFEYASGVNIRLAAKEIDGALVKPGDTFSLNGYTGPRGSAQGYVESGIINNGRPDKAVGGGISQLATTLYNAAYFAGMEDAGHTEHSYYISRYPAAREATVFEGAIDLQFKNASPTGVLIETIGTGSDVTVRLWGTKTVDVQSVTGERYKYTSPNIVTLPKGSACVASGGAQGFTTSDTRVITDHASGKEISRHTRTVKYDPVPIVKCE